MVNKGNIIIKNLRKLIEQGFLFVLVGLILSYLFYDMIEECVILRRVVLAEIILGMIHLNTLLVNRFFGDVFSSLSKKSLIISVIWTVAMCVCLVLGLFINTSGFLVSDNEEPNDINTSREYLSLEKMDIDGDELSVTDSSTTWHCVAEDNYSSTGILTELINYEYDDAGRIKRKIFYNTDGKIEKYEDYIYNKRGNLIKREVYIKNEDATGSKDSYVYAIYDTDNDAYEYDNKNQCIYKRNLSNSSSGNYIAYTYDNDGLLIKKVNYIRGVVDYIAEYHYDDKGNIKDIIQTNMSRGRIYTKTKTAYYYEYDNEGILKKQTEEKYEIYWYSGDWFADTGQYMERDEPDNKTRRTIVIKYYNENGNIEKEEQWGPNYYTDENGEEEMKIELYTYAKYTYEYF